MNIKVDKLSVDVTLKFHFTENRIEILAELPDHSGVPRQIEVRIMDNYSDPSQSKPTVYAFHGANRNSGYDLSVEQIKQTLFPEFFPATATATADEDDGKI